MPVKISVNCEVSKIRLFQMLKCYSVIYSSSFISAKVIFLWIFKSNHASSGISRAALSAKKEGYIHANPWGHMYPKSSQQSATMFGTMGPSPFWRSITILFVHLHLHEIEIISKTFQDLGYDSVVNRKYPVLQYSYGFWCKEFSFGFEDAFLQSKCSLKNYFTKLV